MERGTINRSDFWTFLHFGEFSGQAKLLVLLDSFVCIFYAFIVAVLIGSCVVSISIFARASFMVFYILNVSLTKALSHMIEEQFLGLRSNVFPKLFSIFLEQLGQHYFSNVDGFFQHGCRRASFGFLSFCFLF